MKSVLAVFVIAGFSTVVVAQGLGDLPKCAQGCVGSSINVPGCQGFDVKCICSNRDWLQGISCCLTKTCNPDEQTNAVKVASSLCSAVGVTVPNQVVCPSAAGSSSAAPQSTESKSSSASSSPTKEASSTAPASGSTSASVTSGMSSGSSSTHGSSSGASSSATNTVTAGGSATRAGSATGANTAAQSSSGPSTPTATANAAAPIKVGAGLGLAGMIAAVVALF